MLRDTCAYCHFAKLLSPIWSFVILSLAYRQGFGTHYKLQRFARIACRSRSDRNLSRHKIKKKSRTRWRSRAWMTDSRENDRLDYYNTMMQIDLQNVMSHAWPSPKMDRIFRGCDKQCSFCAGPWCKARKRQYIVDDSRSLATIVDIAASCSLARRDVLTS